MMFKRGIWVAVCIALIAGCLFLWARASGGSDASSVSCPQCNIVLIEIDPLRADALPMYGNSRVTTPALDALAKRGYMFTHAYTVAPWTLPSAMSLMTGVYPSDHSIINKEIIPIGSTKELIPARLPDTMRTLAQTLQSSGYVTGGFAGGAALAASYGFNRGFDQYASEGAFDGLSMSVPAALDFMRSHTKEKMFVFIHGFDVHGQYIPSGGYTHMFTKNYQGNLDGSAEEQKRIREEGVLNGHVSLSSEDVQYLRGLYDEKMVRADEMVGMVMNELEKLHLMEKTIVIFTSNHGEEFYEHRRIDHGMTLFDEVLHVPFILTVPGQKKNVRIDAQVRNIDIAPTILDLIGQKKKDTFAYQVKGKSLIPVLLGRTLKLDVFAETSYRYASFKKAIRTWDNWKLITDEETTTAELYNITKDPRELDDVFIGERVKKTELMDRLLQLMSHTDITQ